MYKQGKCLDCDYIGSLIAGRCNSHYWKYRASLKKDAIKGDRITVSTKKLDPDLGKWFSDQISIAPRHCEECGQSLKGTLSIIPSAVVAHIFPKRKSYGYPSVATHSLNRMFFCIDCHTNFDSKGKDYIIKMESLKLIRSRALKVYNDMSEEEQKRAIHNLDFLLD